MRFLHKKATICIGKGEKRGKKKEEFIKSIMYYF
jgi:hypothetical protein